MNAHRRRGVASRLIPVLVTLALVAACGDAAEVASTTLPPDGGGPGTTTAPVRVPVTDDQPPVTATPDLVDSLASELDVPAGDVNVVADDEVVWPDGGLGCPEPDVAYTMAEVPGRRVVLEFGGIVYEYHSSLEGGFFRCLKPLPPASTATTLPPVPNELRTTADAIAALAGRLGVGTAAVTVVLEENVTWSDGSLGCPQPGMAYTQALVDGRRVVLSVDGVEYHYHGGGGRPLFYCANPSPPATGGFGDA